MKKNLLTLINIVETFKKFYEEIISEVFLIKNLDDGYT